MGGVGAGRSAGRSGGAVALPRSKVPPMRRPLRPLLATAALIGTALLATGCGKARRYGDDGGVPVVFSVTLERASVADMSNRQWRPSVGAGVGMSSGGRSSFGTGVGLSFSATEVYLLGGDGPAEAQIFRRELKWGENRFAVPLTPGRTLHLTVKAQGGREGWESLGAVTIPSAPEPRVTVFIVGDGTRVITEPADTAAPVAAASATAAAARPPAEPGREDRRDGQSGARSDVTSRSDARPLGENALDHDVHPAPAATGAVARPPLGEAALDQDVHPAPAATSAAVRPPGDDGIGGRDDVTGPGDPHAPRLDDAPVDGADRQAPPIRIAPAAPAPAVSPAAPFPDPQLDR